MSKSHLFWMTVLLIVAMPLGCNESTTVEGPDGGTATVTEKGNEVDATVAVALPNDFPKDVPLPTKAEPIRVGDIVGGMNVILKTTESVSEIVAFYRAALVNKGWTVQHSFPVTRGMMIGATKGDQRELTVGVAKGEAATIITLTLSK